MLKLYDCKKFPLEMFADITGLIHYNTKCCDYYRPGLTKYGLSPCHQWQLENTGLQLIFHWRFRSWFLGV
jgi:alanine racemase